MERNCAQQNYQRRWARYNAPGDPERQERPRRDRAFRDVVMVVAESMVMGMPVRVPFQVTRIDPDAMWVIV